MKYRSLFALLVSLCLASPAHSYTDDAGKQGKQGGFTGHFPIAGGIGSGGNNGTFTFDIDLNFVAGTYCYSGGCLPVGSVLTTNRTTTSSAQWADGHYSKFTTGVVRVTDFGVLSEAAITNQILQSRTPATTWVSTSVTSVNNNQTGIYNDANSAGTITATGANGTVCQARTIASTAQTFSVFLKRLVGTGTVSISIDGSTYTDVTTVIANAAANPIWQWARPAILNTTVTNPTVCVKLGTNGDSLAWDEAQLEALPNTTTPMTTTTTTVTRNNEVLTLQDPIKTLVLNAATQTVAVENNNRIGGFASANYLYMAAASVPASNNIVISADTSGGVFAIITNGNGHNATAHVSNNIKAQETQRHAWSLAVNNEPFVTSVGVGSGTTGGYYVPQAFQLTADTLPSLVGGTIIIGGTTSGGTEINDYVRRVAWKLSTTPYASLQNWVNGYNISNNQPFDPWNDNKNLFNSTLVSTVSSASYPAFGSTANHVTNIISKTVPDATNVSLLTSIKAGYARIGWTWAAVETQQSSFTGAQAPGTGTAAGLLTVSAKSSGTIAVGQNIADAAQGGTPATITGSATVNSGACSPACTGNGSTGTYGTSVSQTIGSRALTSMAYDWSGPSNPQSNPDQLVATLGTAGIKINWVCGSYNTNYGVAFQTMPTTTYGIAAFSNFCTAVANRYAAVVGAANFTMEILNEPNLGPPYLTAAQYATAYNTVAAAIHTAQASMPIITAGMGNQGQASPNDPNTYITNFMAARTAFITGVSDHPYVNGSAGNPEAMIALGSSFKAAAGGSTPVYFTEQGYTLPWTGQSDQRKFGWTARSLLTQLIIQPALWEWYDLVDDGTDPTDIQSNFGLFDYNYNALPASTGYTAIRNLLLNSTSYNILQSSTWVYQANFTLASGSTSRVVWIYHMPAYQINHTVDAGTTSGLTVTDLFGNSVAYTLSGTKVTVLLSEYQGPLVITTTGSPPSCSGTIDLSTGCTMPMLGAL